MISIVVPVFNEEESLEHFLAELKRNLPALKESWEIIFIDDGSNDNSLKILKEFERKDKNIKVFSFRKNLGKAEALTAGFQKAKGDYVITLDADLQDQPSEIGKLLDKVKNNWDVATGWRQKRKDSLLRTFPSRIFNILVSTFMGLKLHDYNSGLKAYKADAAKSLMLYGGMHRFIPLLSHMEGFSVVEVPVVHKPRLWGKAKYGLSRLWKDFPDMFTMLFLSRYSKQPMHFFGFFGIFLLLTGVIILIYLTILHFAGESIGGRPLLIFGVLFIVSGFQVLFTGFLADLILHESQNSGTSNSKTLFKYESN